jgi:ribosomal protein L32E
MRQDQFIREKFTKLRQAAKKLAVEYFERYPKDRYQTEIESWRHLQSEDIEFTMKRLREPTPPDR